MVFRMGNRAVRQTQQAASKVSISPNIDQLSSQRVYIDFKWGLHNPQRVTFYLYDKILPKTTENFKALCESHKLDAEHKIEFGYKVNSHG